MDLKFIKLLAPLFVGSFLITSAIATDYQAPVSWIANNDGSAGVVYSNDYSDDIRVLEAEVSHSERGYQRLYFSDFYFDNLNVCTYSTSIPSSTTIIFNQQAVKMLRWCKKFDDTDQYYFLYTPETDQGESHIINLFKRATSPIEIKYNNETLYFPVIGFTKAWNSAGGDAI